MEQHDTQVLPNDALNDVFGKRALENVFELWIGPEIDRRRQAGTIGEDFNLWIAQAIFTEKGLKQIRLNEEARAIMIVKSSRPVELGEEVRLSDLSGIEGVELCDDELDCGHFTVVRRGDGWLLDFNALYGRKKAANLVRLADEFLATAKYAASHMHSGSAIDNLFSCCELLAKSELIMTLSTAATAKRHGSIASGINRWGKLGNVHPVFVALINRLGDQRQVARYEGAATVTMIPSIEEFEVVTDYLSHLRHRSAAKLSHGQAD